MPYSLLQDGKSDKGGPLSGGLFPPPSAEARSSSEAQFTQLVPPTSKVVDVEDAIEEPEFNLEDSL